MDEESINLTPLYDAGKEDSGGCCAASGSPFSETPETDEYEANLIGCCQPETHLSSMADFARNFERDRRSLRCQVVSLRVAAKAYLKFSAEYHASPWDTRAISNYNASKKWLDAALSEKSNPLDEVERQRNIAIAELRRIQNTYGHKSTDGCECDDCHQIRPIEEALRAAQSPEKTPNVSHRC